MRKGALKSHKELIIILSLVLAGGNFYGGTKAEAAFTETVTTDVAAAEIVEPGQGSAGGNDQTVNAGGITHNNTIKSGSVQIVNSGGKTNTNSADRGHFESGSNQIVNAGGISNLDIFNSATQTVSGTANFTILESGSTQTIQAGGLAFQNEVREGSIQDVESGGTARSSIVNGVQNLKVGSLVVGGTSLGTTGVQNVYITLGTNSNGTYVAGNGVINVYAGGEVQRAMLNDLGNNYTASAKLNVKDGAKASRNTLNSYAVMTVEGGGTATGNIFNNHASMKLEGTAAKLAKSSGNAFNWNSIQYVNAYGESNNDNFSAAAWQIVDGGVANNSTFYCNYAGKSEVRSGILNNPKFMSNYGYQFVSGGTVNNATFNSNIDNYQSNSGGTINNTIFNKSGSQNISAGTTHLTTFNNTGSQNITGGSVDNTTFKQTGSQNIAGGNVDITTFNKSGSQTITGGTITTTKFKADGTQSIATGTVTDTTFEGIGDQTITSGTVASTVFKQDGTQDITTGTVTDTTFGGTGRQTIVDGLITNTTFSGDGTQNITTGTVTDTTFGGTGVQTIAAGTVNNTIFQGQATQVIKSGNVDNVTFANGFLSTQTVEGGNVSHVTLGDATTTDWQGGTIDYLKIVNGSNANFFNDGIVISNVDMSGGTMRLGANGGNYHIAGNFNFTNGLVDMVSNPDGSNPNPRSYETLNIDYLSGNDGIFKLDTDLNQAVYGSETTKGDKVNVTNGDSNAFHYVQVVDESLYNGQEISGDRQLLVVTDNSGSNFVMKGKDLNNGGVWFTHAPELFKEGNKWYIGYIKKDPTNDTSVIISDRQVAVYNQWARISHDSLRKRLGDLRYNESEAGVWARYYNGKLAGSGYDQQYHTYQVGIDKTNGHSSYGLAFERQESNQAYTYGSGEGATNAGNVYFTNYADNGSYVDAIFKYGKINSKYNTVGDFPDRAEYNTKAYSLSLEYGKYNKLQDGYFFAPRVELTYGHLGAADYTTNRGTHVAEDAIKSLIGKVGFVAGRKIHDHSDYYFKAGWFREFKGDRNVNLYAANGEYMPKNESYSDSWFEIGLGGNVKIAKKTHLYGDIEKSFGAAIQKKWQINAGIRWEF